MVAKMPRAITTSSSVKPSARGPRPGTGRGWRAVMGGASDGAMRPSGRPRGASQAPSTRTAGPAEWRVSWGEASGGDGDGASVIEGLLSQDHRDGGVMGHGREHRAEE